MSIANAMRCALVAAGLGAAIAVMMAAVALPGWAQNAPQASAGAISIDNFTFRPQTLTLKTGTTVTWTNRDDIPHGIGTENNAFTKSRALDTDDTYSCTFATPGTYQCFCYIHPFMVGTVVVQAASGSNKTQ